MARPLNIAHRGGAGLFPENTLAAFRDAVARGCDGAELDVQLSRDGEVVVYHDYRLKPEITRGAQDRFLSRPTPRIKDLTLAELWSFDVGRCDPESSYARLHPAVAAVDGERIPTLEEVIAAAKSSAKPFTLFVELKTSFGDRDESADPVALADATVAVLRRADYLSRTIFVGFDWAGLLHVKQISPDARCWFTTLAQSWFREGAPAAIDDPPSEPALQVLRHWASTCTSPWAAGFDAANHGGSIRRAIKAAGGDGWFPTYTDIDAGTVAEARALGLAVGCWTVDDPADMRRLIDLELDAICTDRPDVLGALVR
ncbi:MAG: glycerophosphodiester phosphodiesterase [Alphaproteobacteria bacterium]|nr:glycerophosphodiester phosphodiesterase [Alphaproteobacteria bacterium]MBV9694323.1 glycerophosphodiester phosphodiesterase [Alphaproteobacteria bacterium]